MGEDPTTTPVQAARLQMPNGTEPSQACPYWEPVTHPIVPTWTGATCTHKTWTQGDARTGDLTRCLLPLLRHMSPLSRCPVRSQVYTTVHTACEHRGTCTHKLALLDAVSLPGWLPSPSSSLETQNLTSPMCEEDGHPGLSQLWCIRDALGGAGVLGQQESCGPSSP